MNTRILVRRHSTDKGDLLDYSLPENQYFTTKALGSGTITLTLPASITTSYITDISYRKNGGAWTTTANSSSLVTISVSVATNDVVEWKGNGNKFTINGNANNYSYFSSTCQCNIYGNILSLLYNDEFIGKNSTPTDTNHVFNSFFKSWTNLISAANLILPVTSVGSNNKGQYLYCSLFNGCTGLIYPPSELPQITSSAIAAVYYHMFEGCSSLVRCPDMNWGVIGSCTESAFSNMFAGCKALSQNIPEKIEVYEYNYSGTTGTLFKSMFNGCVNITTIPSLIIQNYISTSTATGNAAFHTTFNGCTSLVDVSNKTVAILAQTNNNAYEFYQTFYGCTALEKSPILKIPDTHKNTFNRTFEGINRQITDVYLDIDSIYSTNTPADEAFYYMFVNTGGVTSNSAYRGNSSTLHLYGNIYKSVDFDSAHGIWGVTSGTGYTGWSPYWSIVKEQVTRTIYFDDFDTYVSGIWDSRENCWIQRTVEDEICNPKNWGVDTFVYDGDTMMISNKVYYIWRPANVDWNSIINYDYSMALVTTTLDYSTLYIDSLIYDIDNNVINYNSITFGHTRSAKGLYALLKNDATYMTSTDLYNGNYYIVNLSTINIEDEV